LSEIVASDFSGSSENTSIASRSGSVTHSSFGLSDPAHVVGAAAELGARGDLLLVDIDEDDLVGRAIGDREERAGIVGGVTP